MRIRRNIVNFVVDKSARISEALDKINSNQCKQVFVVGEANALYGSLSDGDIRRHFQNSASIDTSAAVSEICNKAVTSARATMNRQKIENLFSRAIQNIPIVDDSGKIVAIASQGDPALEISEEITISSASPAFIIAEIGNNHQGDIGLAKLLIESAVDSGVDCVKFQMRSIDTIYGDQRKGLDLGVEYTISLLEKHELSHEQLFELFDYCRTLGVLPLCTPWDEVSLTRLEDYGMEAYKVSSADFTNSVFLEYLVDTKKPLICSTGMSTEQEIKTVIQFLDENFVEYVLLHCNSTYPTPFKDVNLKYLVELQNISKKCVGYSGHERGISVPVGAIALGAKVIEKHLTVDRTLEGVDHKVSLLPDEMKMMVQMIRDLELSLGSSGARLITQGEMINRENLAKSVVAREKLRKGEIISREKLGVRSPGGGLQPLYISSLVGRRTSREVEKDSFFYQSDLSNPDDYISQISVQRPVGVPVRYHDFSEIIAASRGILNFVEFHLSFCDLMLSPSEYLDEDLTGLGYVVHAPELFQDDQLLDLASSNYQIWRSSLDKLQSVVEVTQHLKRYFPGEKLPAIVVNVGGFSREGFVEIEDRKAKYARVRQAINSLETEGVELLIQTMPPFPWHFGGQAYHNIFVDPREIAEFCTHSNIRICLDISHTQMACKFYGWNLRDSIRLLAPFVGHIHLSDADGIDGEGVAFGKGDINFREVCALLDEVMPNVRFIPEVWQGHKNSGEGFWHGLAYLSGLLR